MAPSAASSLPKLDQYASETRRRSSRTRDLPWSASARSSTRTTSPVERVTSCRSNVEATIWRWMTAGAAKGVEAAARMASVSLDGMCGARRSRSCSPKRNRAKRGVEAIRPSIPACPRAITSAPIQAVASSSLPREVDRELKPLVVGCGALVGVGLEPRVGVQPQNGPREIRHRRHRRLERASARSQRTLEAGHARQGGQGRLAGLLPLRVVGVDRGEVPEVLRVGIGESRSSGALSYASDSADDQPKPQYTKLDFGHFSKSRSGSSEKVMRDARVSLPACGR